VVQKKLTFSLSIDFVARQRSEMSQNSVTMLQKG